MRIWRRKRKPSVVGEAVVRIRPDTSGFGEAIGEAFRAAVDAELSAIQARVAALEAEHRGTA